MKINNYFRVHRLKLGLLSPVSIFLFFNIMLTACVENELSIELPDLEENSLAVLAVMDNGRPPSVLLSKVEPLDNEAVFYPVSQALVILYQDNLPLDTLKRLVNLTQQTDPLNNSIYYSDDVLNFREGSSYHIMVQADGYTTAVSEYLTYRRFIAPAVQIDKVVTDSSNGLIGNVNIIFETLRDVNDGEFVIQNRSEATREIYNGTAWTEEQIADDIRLSRIDLIPFLLNESRSLVGIDLPPGSYRSNVRNTGLDLFGQRLSISITNYSPHYLVFAEAFTRQDRENIGGLGTLTQQLPSNIQGGFGYFTIRDNQTVFLN